MPCRSQVSPTSSPWREGLDNLLNEATSLQLLYSPLRSARTLTPLSLRIPRRLRIWSRGRTSSLWKRSSSYLIDNCTGRATSTNSQRSAFLARLKPFTRSCRKGEPITYNFLSKSQASLTDQVLLILLWKPEFRILYILSWARWTQAASSPLSYRPHQCILRIRLRLQNSSKLRPSSGLQCAVSSQATKAFLFSPYSFFPHRKPKQCFPSPQNPSRSETWT